MTDQRPTEQPTTEGLPEATPWSPTDPQSDSLTVGQTDFNVPATFAEAMSQMAVVGEAEMQGSIFPVVDKEVLLGKRFIIVDYQWNRNETGPFVSLRVIDTENHRWCINDGGTGIYKQWQQWEHDFPERKTYIDVPNGLRKSVYVAKWKEVNKETGEIEDKTGEATTYYIA